MSLSQLWHSFGRAAVVKQGFREGKEGRELSTIILMHSNPDVVNDYRAAHAEGVQARSAEAIKEIAKK